MSKTIYVKHNDTTKSNKYSRLFEMASKGLAQSIENFIVILNELVDESCSTRLIEVKFLTPMTESEIKRFLDYGFSDVIGLFEILKSTPNLKGYSYIDTTKVEKEVDIHFSILEKLGIKPSGGGFVTP